MNLKSKSALVLITLLSTGTAVMAQTKAPEPDYTLSYNVGVVSDYRFRGISQTSFKPALQGGVDFSHKSGLYLGVWGSNVNWVRAFSLANDGALEIDVYGGYKGSIGGSLGYDLGFITYNYPGSNAATNAYTAEVYGALTYNIVTVKYSQAVTNFVANASSAGSSYLEVAATFDLGNGFSLTPHVGKQTVPNQAANADYTDFSLSLGKDFGNGLSAFLTVYSTDADDAFYKVGTIDNLGKSGAAVGLKYSF